MLDIDEYVGQENLNSNVENAGGREAEIERRVALYDRRPEAVDKVAEIVRVLLYALARVFDGEKAYNSADGNERAEENKASGIACGLNADAESDGDYNRCEHGQESQYRLRGAAVLRHGDIRDPRVERGVIRGRAEEGHYAVHDDNHADCSGEHLGAVGNMEELSDILARNEGEHRDGEAPNYVAAAYEDFASVEFVAESAHDKGGHYCRHRRGCDHLGYVVGSAADIVEQECVEVDILNSPRNLSYEAEQDDVEENPSSEFFLFQLCILLRERVCRARFVSKVIITNLKEIINRFCTLLLNYSV